MGRDERVNQPTGKWAGQRDKVPSINGDKGAEQLTAMEALKKGFLLLCQQYQQMGEQIKFIGEAITLVTLEEQDRLLRDHRKAKDS